MKFSLVEFIDKINPLYKPDTDQLTLEQSKNDDWGKAYSSTTRTLGVKHALRNEIKPILNTGFGQNPWLQAIAFGVLAAIFVASIGILTYHLTSSKPSTQELVLKDAFEDLYK